jgi:hypothetical protein
LEELFGKITRLQFCIKHPATYSGDLAKNKMFERAKKKWLRGLDLNQRPSGYEPGSL